MKVGFVGLGKLGLPCAVAMDYCGHDVMGHDVDPRKMTTTDLVGPILDEVPLPGMNSFAESASCSRVRFGTLEEVVDHAEILFVAVQTPHDPKFGGDRPIPEDRTDFDYTYLYDCLDKIQTIVDNTGHSPLVSVISTVLPGTMARWVESKRPPSSDLGHMIRTKLEFVYNPYFIAMGTVIPDFLDPEFTLLGSNNEEHTGFMRLFYETIHNKPVMAVSIESAELAKVSYNTFIGTKIVFANTLMEMCSRLPNADCDEVIDVLSHASDRIISAKYLRGGMGDGGGCHPRDNIAMSWLARKLGTSTNLFDYIMMAREDQTNWLARLLSAAWLERRLPVYVLGKAFKAGLKLVDGSPAILLTHLLDKCDIPYTAYDPMVDAAAPPWSETDPAIFLIATRHDCWKRTAFPRGSLVFDPHRYLKDQKGVVIHRLGAKNSGLEYRP